MNTLANRIVISFLAVLAVLLGLACFGYRTGGWEDDPPPLMSRFGLASAETQPELCMDEQSKERVRNIMTQALDEALKTKIEELYSVWLRDSTGQPARAAKGADNAIRAYINARASVMTWNPPPCGG